GRTNSVSISNGLRARGLTRPARFGPVCGKSVSQEMKELFAGFVQAKWPRPADPAAVEVRFDQWREAASALPAADRKFAQAMAKDRSGRTMLAAIFGNSPYLS